MRVLRLLPLALALAAAACAPDNRPPPGPTAVLPPDAVQGAGDPVRTALTGVSSAFSAPRRMANNPSAAARAIAEMEFLASDLPRDPRYTGLAPNLPVQLAQGRQEWRAVLGIAPEAPPQPVINALFAAVRALDAGDAQAAAAALPTAIFTRGGTATLELLANLPPLPATNVAAVAAGQLLRLDEGTGGLRR